MNKFNSVLLALVFAISAITFSSSAMATESGNKGFPGISFPWCKIFHSAPVLFVSRQWCLSKLCGGYS
ncbi:hypothetical protein, partial [Salmonella enterica]|uniref:hypothetical protein n=1 Tax=Salmonella enterica TaxID=28901 RepID=UPI001E367927